MDERSQDELLELLEATSEDRCDEQALRTLESLLREQPALVRTFVHYRDMHATLCWLVANQENDVAESKKPPATVGLIEPPFQRSSPNKSRRFRLEGDRRFMLAASLLLLATGFFAGSLWRSNQPGVAVLGSPSSVQSVSEDKQGLPLAETKPELVATGEESIQSDIARVTGLVDCKREGHDLDIPFGMQVRSGERIELDEGLLQLTFSSGAKVILQGPARFVPQSSMLASLESGKLSAVVSEQARGYTVTTPTAEIVDLGTEFALDVAGDGSTELHVLQGDVIARRRLPDGELRGEAVHARKLDGYRFAENQDEALWINAEPDKFARQITPKLSRDELPAMPVSRDLKLWLAADLLTSRDSDDRVTAWRDVCVGDNQISNDACQFFEEAQPLWVADAGNGRAAIRFNGKSQWLATDAFSTGDQVSIFVAFKGSEKPKEQTHWGGHLLNFGGVAPTIELGMHHDDVVHSGLWAADAVGVGIKVGTINTQRVPHAQTCVLTYTYDLASDQAQQWVNGKSIGRASAPLAARVNSAKIIGAHGNPFENNAFYRGDIFELLIYNDALNDAELRAVNHYLLDRYRTGASSSGGSSAPK